MSSEDKIVFKVTFNAEKPVDNFEAREGIYYLIELLKRSKKKGMKIKIIEDSETEEE